MPRAHTKDPAIRLSDDIGTLVTKNEVAAELDIPNAASRVKLTVSLLRKTLDLTVNIETPKDVKQQRAAINFVLSQFKKSTVDDLIVRVNWPRRVAATEMLLQPALDEESRKALIPENFKDLPSSVDLIRVIDLGTKLKTATGLPEIAEVEVTRFYQDAVQGLENWVPKAPKVRKAKNSDSAGAPSELVISVIDDGPLIDVADPPTGSIESP